RLVALLLRAGGGGAGVQPFDLVPLSQARRAGPDSSRRPSASAATTSLCGAISSRPVRRRGQAASGTIVEAVPTRCRCAVGAQAGGRPTPRRRLAQGSGREPDGRGAPPGPPCP